MTNAYQVAQKKQITGTPEQIVAVLRALSQENIPAAKLRLWLSDHNLLAYDGSGWFGLLEEATLSPEMTLGIRDLKARVLSGDAVRTAEVTYAPKVLQIVSGIAQAMPQIAGLVDSFYALDGGRPWKDLTVEQYLAQKATAEFREPLEARVTNASALMLERATADDTLEQLAAKWSQAWTEAV
jgi:hypothetical protein